MCAANAPPPSSRRCVGARLAAGEISLCERCLPLASQVARSRQCVERRPDALDVCNERAARSCRSRKRAR
eukprot:2041570-Pyramimonas_sp.AAC.3